MSEGKVKKSETKQSRTHVLPTWDYSGSVTILETAENVKEELETNGASYCEMQMSEMIDFLLNLLKRCDKTTEEGKVFDKLNKLWREEK